MVIFHCYVSSPEGKLGQTESSMTLLQSVGAEQPKSTTFTTTGGSDGSKPKSRIILDPFKTDHDVHSIYIIDFNIS